MLVENYYRHMAMLFASRTETFRDIGGNNRALRESCYTKSWCDNGSATLYPAIEVDSSEGDSSYGIVVGTSDTPPTLSDYAINKIPHGVSPGQLYYYATELSGVIVSGSVIELEVTRRFMNQSSEDVEVKEFGLIGKLRGYRILLAREVSTVTVPAEGGVLEVSFKFKTTV